MSNPEIWDFKSISRIRTLAEFSSRYFINSLGLVVLYEIQASISCFAKIDSKILLNLSMIVELSSHKTKFNINFTLRLI